MWINYSFKLVDNGRKLVVDKNNYLKCDNNELYYKMNYNIIDDDKDNDKDNDNAMDNNKDNDKGNEKDKDKDNNNFNAKDYDNDVVCCCIIY